MWMSFNSFLFMGFDDNGYLLVLVGELLEQEVELFALVFEESDGPLIVEPLLLLVVNQRPGNSIRHRQGRLLKRLDKVIIDVFVLAVVVGELAVGTEVFHLLLVAVDIKSELLLETDAIGFLAASDHFDVFYHLQLYVSRCPSPSSLTKPSG